MRVLKIFFIFTIGTGCTASYEHSDKSGEFSKKTSDDSSGEGGQVVAGSTAVFVSDCLSDENIVSVEDGSLVCLQDQSGDECTVSQTDYGVEFACGDSVFFVRHGEDGIDGVDGSPCSATQVESGMLIQCGESSTQHLILNNVNPDQDESCRVTRSQVEDYVTFSCGDTSFQFEIENPFGIENILDPCGPHDGFDEVLIQLNDGRYLSYFRDFGNREFLVVLDPEYDAGQYVTTDWQECVFTLEPDGSLTW